MTDQSLLREYYLKVLGIRSIPLGVSQSSPSRSDPSGSVPLSEVRREGSASYLEPQIHVLVDPVDGSRFGDLLEKIMRAFGLAPENFHLEMGEIDHLKAERLGEVSQGNHPVRGLFLIFAPEDDEFRNKARGFGFGVIFAETLQSLDDSKELKLRLWSQIKSEKEILAERQN